jgi:hypothetical protein
MDQQSGKIHSRVSSRNIFLNSIAPTPTSRKEPGQDHAHMATEDDGIFGDWDNLLNEQRHSQVTTELD